MSLGRAVQIKNGSYLALVPQILWPTMAPDIKAVVGWAA
jgi:hypothetical protein